MPKPVALFALVLLTGCSSSSTNQVETNSGSGGGGGSAALNTGGTAAGAGGAAGVAGGAGGNAGSVGVGGIAPSGGGPNCPALAPAGTFPSPAARTLDDFNRPDGALGGKWAGDIEPVPVLKSNALYYPSSGAGSVLYTEKLCPDQEVLVKVVSIDQVQHLTLQLRMQSSTHDCDQIEVVFDGVDHSVFVHYCDAANFWRDAGDPVPVTLANGDEIGARARTNGQVEVYRNGSLLLNVDTSPWPFTSSDGFPGLEVQVLGGELTLDDFGGTG